MNTNIVLVGFMAVGKGTTARVLAERTGMYAVDSDDLIESLCNMKISKLFRQHGEERFRELERQTALWLRQNVRETIISTGGGFINVPDIKAIGRVVYLHGTFETIMTRLHSKPNADKKIKKRPLLKDLARAKELCESRTPLYRRAADCEIAIEGKTTEQICEEIIAAFELPTRDRRG